MTTFFENAKAAAASVLAACDEPGVETPTTYFSEQEMATAANLRDAALEGSGTWEILAELVSVAPKRLAGSPGDKLARDWAVEKLESLGFDRVWVQEFKLRGWERLSASATVLGDEEIEQAIAVHIHPGSRV